MGLLDDWTIPGAEHEPILGNTERPPPHSPPRGIIIVAHGFKGYKDYGMFPRIAHEFAAAGFMAHRFNFSHSGMTNTVVTFERPDLFEHDTYNKQVLDLRTVIHAATAGPLRDAKGTDLPYIIFGHSRGGVTALLAAGRLAGEASFPQPAGIVTAAAPSSCNPFTRDEASQLLADGYLVSPSSRTGQPLRIGKAFLQEQIDEPASHDLIAQVRRIQCPMLVIHGDRDPTVPVQCAHDIANANRLSSIRIIPNADHVFNTPNPMPEDAAPSPQLAALLSASLEFASRIVPKASNKGPR